MTGNPVAAQGGREALGRSRGGLSTKIHLTADRRCRPLTRLLGAGQHGDCPKLILPMEAIRISRLGKGRPRTRPAAAMGDKAYSSAANRAYLRRYGPSCCWRWPARRSPRCCSTPGSPSSGPKAVTAPRTNSWPPGL
jgi:hypothetical protein